MKISNALKEFVNLDSFKSAVNSEQENALFMALVEWSDRLGKLMNNGYTPSMEDSLLDLLDNAGIDWLKKINAISKSMQTLFINYSKDYLFLPPNIRAIENAAFSSGTIKKVDYEVGATILGKNYINGVEFNPYKYYEDPTADPLAPKIQNIATTITPSSLSQASNLVFNSDIASAAITMDNGSILNDRIKKLEEDYKQLFNTGANGFDETYIRYLIHQVIDEEKMKNNTLFNND